MYVTSTLTRSYRYQLPLRRIRGFRALPRVQILSAEIALTVSPAANPIPMQRELPPRASRKYCTVTKA